MVPSANLATSYSPSLLTIIPPSVVELPCPAGYIQALIERESVIFRLGTAPTCTWSSAPSKVSAPSSILPALQVGPPCSVPVLPLPVASDTVLPLPSSNVQCATASVGAGGKNALKTSIQMRSWRTCSLDVRSP